MTTIVVTRILPTIYKGDCAIATAMLEGITAAQPDWKITLMCRDPLRDRQCFERFGVVEPELFAQSNSKHSYFGVATRLLRYLLWSIGGGPWLDPDGRHFIRVVSGADALVFCGGGSPGGYGFANLVLHALAPLLLARRLQVPVIFSATGLEPGLGFLSRLISRWVFSQAELVVARDPADAREISLLGVKTKPVVTADWALALRSMPASELQDILGPLAEPQLSGARIGINLRDDRRPGSEYRSCISQTINLLMDRTDAYFIVVSMNRSKSTDDLLFAKSVRESLPISKQRRMIIVDEDYSPQAIRAIISTVDVFIATRLHPTIFALLEAVPVLALHSGTKVRDFMARCGLSEYFVSPDNNNSAEVVALAIRLLSNRHEVSGHMRTDMPALLESAAENVPLLESCIGAFSHKNS